MTINKIFIFLFAHIFTQVHFVDLPNETGIYHPIIIEECLGLDTGDEIGVFDNNGLVSDDCSSQTNEILVGSGIYNGQQLTISGIGSFDFCDLEDGYQLPGWINDNSIFFKVWDASENIEYIPEVSFSTGTGNWGDIFSVVDILTVNELSNFKLEEFNLVNLFPNPFNNSIKISITNFDFISELKITIYDILGNEILVKFLNNSNTSYTWNANGFESGIYLINFSNSNFSLTKKITLLK